MKEKSKNKDKATVYGDKYHPVNVKLTHTQYNEVSKKAKKAKLAVTTYCKNLVLNKELNIGMDHTLKEKHLVELNKIGTNFNQFVKKIHLEDKRGSINMDQIMPEISVFSKMLFDLKRQIEFSR